MENILEVQELEKAISLAFGGKTSFDVEDCHARYFNNIDVDGVEYEYKSIHDGYTDTGIQGEIWYRPAESEDWYDTGCDEKYLGEQLRKQMRQDNKAV
ncbi:hypothetical protein Q0V21_31195 [Paenibacillus sp. 11B]|uniref:hypothetical protein n=1 Tax=Paenibacillus sp. 11B TaxID=3060965 RepID=UPI0026531DE4|nr:hypothetical protein [Paenibacillus sp. 11B]MDN8593198.1 hypothetical protein [Paenibacillus sp. 11B]